MNQVIRILAIAQRLRDSNLRYKIAYRRNIQNGYDITKGDELDQAIFDFFNQRQPTQIGWEYIKIDIGIPDPLLTNVLQTFSPLTISLIITPSLDSQNQVELSDLQGSNRVFHPIDRQVTLFHRTSMGATHENWASLPTEIRLSINYKIYTQLSQTIFPY